MAPKLPTHNIAPIESYQIAADQKSEAHDFFMNTWRDLQLAQVHPWHAEDSQLIGMGEAAVAYANDRMAEILLANGKQTDRLGKDTVSADIYQFALDLSGNARRQMAAAGEHDSATAPRTFTEQTQINLSAEAMTPAWPQRPDGGDLPEWQGRTSPLVTLDFVRGTAAAARELQADVYHYIAQYEAVRIAPVPWEYAALINPTLTDKVNTASDYLAQMAGYLDQTQLEPDVLATVYEYVHASYSETLWAFTALFCPPVLGTDPESGWIPDRSAV